MVDFDGNGSRGPSAGASEAKRGSLLVVSEVWVDRVSPRAPVFGERGRSDRSDQKTKAGSGGGLAGASEGPDVGSPMCERIRLMGAGWVIMAISRRRPPQCPQTSAWLGPAQARGGSLGGAVVLAI